MDQECTDAYCLLEEFLKRAGMKRGVFYRHYKNNAAYRKILGLSKDDRGRIQVRAEAVTTLRRDYDAKQSHGNRGRRPTRECRYCDYLGHPRHTQCLGCGRTYEPL